MDKFKKAMKIIILSVLVLNFLATVTILLPNKVAEIRAAEAQASGEASSYADVSID